MSLQIKDQALLLLDQLLGIATDRVYALLGGTLGVQGLRWGTLGCGGTLCSKLLLGLLVGRQLVVGVVGRGQSVQGELGLMAGLNVYAGTTIMMFNDLNRLRPCQIQLGQEIRELAPSLPIFPTLFQLILHVLEHFDPSFLPFRWQLLPPCLYHVLLVLQQLLLQRLLFRGQWRSLPAGLILFQLGTREIESLQHVLLLLTKRCRRPLRLLHHYLPVVITFLRPGAIESVGLSRHIEDGLVRTVAAHDWVGFARLQTCVGQWVLREGLSRILGRGLLYEQSLQQVHIIVVPCH